jgi:hypothetical protein
MIEQLEESIRFDGPMDRKYMPKLPETRGEALTAAKHEVEKTTQRAAEERQRTEQRNAWVRALRESLA